MRRSSSTSFLCAIAAASLSILAAGARAQDSAAKAPEARPTSLPSKANWTFNLDAGVGYFSFGNSLYQQTRPDDPASNSGANWAEGYVKPAISGVLPAGKSEWYGKLSVVGERTFAAPPPLVGSEASSYGLEDFYIGWRSGKSMSMGENALDFTLGMAPYRIGQGMLLWDGGGEGGVRGGFWSNARKSWQYAAIGRLNVKQNLVELFYLDRNEVPGYDLATKTWGINYQRTIGEHTTLGASYFKFSTDSFPDRNGLGVFNLRAFTTPFKSIPTLALQAEWAQEKNGDLVNSMSWYFQAAYGLDKLKWKPTITYRYAFFEGDDPSTTTNENFDPLYPGFYDWGTWWQGEIAGEYFVANSNLISNQLRLSLAPSEKVSPGLIAYQFSLDRLTGAATSKNLAFELDGYCDWKATPNITMSFVLAYLNPQAAVQQEFGRTKDMVYTMIYMAYAY